MKPYFQPETLAHTLQTDVSTGLKSFKSPSEDFTLAVEALDPIDDRARGPEMNEVKKAEICAFLERGTFKVLLREEVSHDANVLPGRFVLSLKSTIDGKTKYRAS